MADALLNDVAALAPEAMPTPHRDRIAALGARLEHIQTSLELESTRRFDAMAQHLEATDMRLETLTREEVALTDEAMARIEALEGALMGERNAREVLGADVAQQMQEVEARLGAELEAVRAGRRESEGRVRKVLEEASTALRGEFARELRLMEQARAELAALGARDIPLLHERLTALRGERQACALRLRKRCEDRVSELRASILQEKKLREELEEAILRMLSDVADHLQREMDSERKERASTEGILISVLEETCGKLHAQQ